jgi:2-C-methyl-D-erythritol 4-phosphate cytidylyltransferase/2-C-methyl-D-erythritol 2,4-cyclodiphosphate synthase
MNNCFIILAGGESKRFNSKIPKSYHLFKGKPLLLHSIDKAKDYKIFQKIVLVINKKHKKLIDKLKIKGVKIIEGGNTRAESSYKALKGIRNYNIKNVMIHDAARPNFSLKLLDKLIKELKQNDCVIPAIKSTDSIKQKSSNQIKNLKRDNIYLIQTPQAFDYKTLYNLQNSKSTNITDDSSLLVGTGKKIKIIKGEVDNNKITINSDIKIYDKIRY